MKYRYLENEIIKSDVQTIVKQRSTPGCLVAQQARACQGLVKGLSRVCQGLVKGLSRACQVPVKGVSRVCQGRVKGLSSACQGLVKGLSKRLSRAYQSVCQGVVKGVSRGCQGCPPLAVFLNPALPTPQPNGSSTNPPIPQVEGSPLKKGEHVTYTRKYPPAYPFRLDAPPPPHARTSKRK